MNSPVNSSVAVVKVGVPPPKANPASTTTEQYDGTSWTSVPPMATGRRALGGAGTQTVGLAFGGTTGSNTAVTEEWSGPQTTATASTLTTS